MFPLDYLVAAALLAAPPGSDDPPGAADLYAGLVPIIQHLAVSWEILDPRETRYVLALDPRKDHYALARPADFKSDMNLLRQRFHDLLDAPPLADCLRFPPRNTVTELLSFNRRYREHLEKYRAAGTLSNQHYDSIVQEAECLYQLWDAVRDSRTEYYYITVRRQALKKIISMIGETAFYSGNYPPHVPLWHFQRID